MIEREVDEGSGELMKERTQAGASSPSSHLSRPGVWPQNGT